MGYQEQLQHPMWQRKRLEIMQRDEFTCRHCSTKEKTLTVHHRYYKKSEDGGFNDLWDYPDACFLTLCSECHDLEEEQLKAIMSTAFFELREFAVGAQEIVDIIGYVRDSSLMLGRPVSIEDIMEIHEDFLRARGWIEP